MARFRFVAADSMSQVHDGTIDAATQTDARNKLASNGLAVRELEEIGPGAEPRAAPDRRSQAAAEAAAEPLPPRRPPQSAPVEAAGRGTSAPLVIAVIALIVGTGVGYMMGRMPASVSLDARIPMTPQGGAKLQFDYELGQK